MSVFVDAGGVWGPNDSASDGSVDFADFSLDEMRYSAGMAVIWLSPMGPIRLSLAKPLKQLEGDEEEMFQFQLGNVF